jgi:hypothetical protein
MENTIFSSLEDYFLRALQIYRKSPENPNSFININSPEDAYNVFFLVKDYSLDVIQEFLKCPEHLCIQNIEVFLDKGFLLLTPIKASSAIGKFYEVSYCLNNTRIISKNLTRLGYIFASNKEDRIQRNNPSDLYDDFLLCAVNRQSDDDLINIDDRKRLIEITPNVFLLFNKQATHQVVLVAKKSS